MEGDIEHGTRDHECLCQVGLCLEIVVDAVHGVCETFQTDGGGHPFALVGEIGLDA